MGKISRKLNYLCAMKNLSLILNAILFVLVGVLFFLHFKGEKKTVAPVVVSSDGKTVTSGLIGYIDIDSFQENYGYFKAKKAELEASQANMESELNRKVSAFQNEYAKLAQKAQTMTEEEGMAAQEKLAKQQQDIEQRKAQMEDKFANQMADFNKTLENKIIEYLKKYNADGKYAYILPYSRSQINLLYVTPTYDLTGEVLKGMNEEWSSNKK